MCHKKAPVLTDENGILIDPVRCKQCDWNNYTSACEIKRNEDLGNNKELLKILEKALK